MKKSSSKSLTFALALIMAMILLALPSCKSLDSVQCTIDSVHHNSVSQLSSLNSQLSTVHDSIVYRERIVQDTVFITKEVYRDKQLSTLNSQLSTIADTIHVVEYRDRVVDHPPERYIPPFYKRCTIAFWAIVVLLCLYIVLRIMKR